MDHYDGYYGMRRKRNIDLSRFRQQDTVTKPNWDEEIELEEGYEYEEIEEVEEEKKEEQDEETKDESNDHPPLYLDGKLFVPKKKLQKKQSFSETHVRVTTYLEKNVHQIIRILQKQGHIDSITQFVNDSIKAYLLEQYSEQNNQ
jgi:hypothetical protein